ncbi:MAG TPA: asparagine synthase-related protein [Pyrinomonadaceae bacterium]|nr:asparagine synthase-related protein [Pyrinomonadaceae bacterium]
MTLIAGIFSRKPGHQLSQTMCDDLTREISRHPNDEIVVMKDSRSFFVKVDVGAFAEPASYVAPDNSLSLLTGEPLLLVDEDGSWQSRKDDLTLIHEDLAGGHWDILKKAQGVFCVVYYNPSTGVLRLMSDKLGIRPLYYCIDDEHVVFASALRILEALTEVPKIMDLRAITEIVGLGYPLANRTPYANISVLAEAEVVTIDERAVAHSSYWRWDDIEPSLENEEHLLDRLHDRFTNAVARRIRNDKSTVSFLSGGLDSRCVVSALNSLGIRVHTFNFARPGTQDHILGNNFARQIGTIHESHPKQHGDLRPDYSSLLSQVWHRSRLRLNAKVERPSAAWSGEGGSGSLGHLHVTETICDLMRAGDVDGAVEEFVRGELVYLSPKLFKSEMFNHLTDVLHKGIKAELLRFHNADAARNFYLFIMLNDQRRKLADHFENIDLHRLEYQLPFFDSDFLSQIMRTPIDWCIGHGFYNKWLSRFDSAVTSVPWQSYPGHANCPVPLPEGLDYQWAKSYQTSERAFNKQQLLKRAGTILRSTDFPSEILNKKNLLLATVAHATGWRDCEHIIETAQTFHSYWKTCRGAYVAP